MVHRIHWQWKRRTLGQQRLQRGGRRAVRTRCRKARPDEEPSPFSDCTRSIWAGMGLRNAYGRRRASILDSRKSWWGSDLCGRSPKSNQKAARRKSLARHRQFPAGSESARTRRGVAGSRYRISCTKGVTGDCRKDLGAVFLDVGIGGRVERWSSITTCAHRL